MFGIAAGRPELRKKFGSGLCILCRIVEPMSVLDLALGLIAVYAAIVTATHVGQTWLFFRPRSPRSAGSVPCQRSIWRVRMLYGENLKGIRTPSREEAAENAPTLLGFGGNGWKVKLPLSLAQAFWIAI